MYAYAVSCKCKSHLSSTILLVCQYLPVVIDVGEVGVVVALVVTTVVHIRELGHTVCV